MTKANSNKVEPTAKEKLTGNTGSDELAGVIQETLKLWRKSHLNYDQTKYVVEQVRKKLTLSQPRQRKRTVDRLALVEEAGADKECVRRMGKYLSEFVTYIENNRAFIPDYGERYRNGEVISTAFVESTVNELVSRRFREKAADAVECQRCAPLAPDACSCFERGV